LCSGLGNLVLVHGLLVDGSHEIEKQGVENGDCEKADGDHNVCVFVESKLPHSHLRCRSISGESRQK